MRTALAQRAATGETPGPAAFGKGLNRKSSALQSPWLSCPHSLICPHYSAPLPAKLWWFRDELSAAAVGCSPTLLSFSLKLGMPLGVRAGEAAPASSEAGLKQFPQMGALWDHSALHRAAPGSRGLWLHLLAKGRAGSCLQSLVLSLEKLLSKRKSVGDLRMPG